MVDDDDRQACGEKDEERLNPHGREPIGRLADEPLSRLWVVSDVVGW